MILVCGEALFDLFSAAATRTGLQLDASVGGSPFNVAVGLARLAQPAAFFATISTDVPGERLLQALSHEGVDTTAIGRTASPTTLSLVGLDAAGVPSYAFYGEHGADRQLGLDALVRLPDGIRAVQLGSYAAVVEPIASTLRALVDARRDRSFIAYDPNVRLNVEPELERWRGQLAWMLTRAHLLKVSEEDLDLLLPRRSLDAFAADALALGVALVVVTRGALGARAWTAGGEANVARVQVEVIDTVGAGDTFQAALLTWLAEHDALSAEAAGRLTAAELGDLLDFASRAAAITCSRRGADMPRRDELD